MKSYIDSFIEYALSKCCLVLPNDLVFNSLHDRKVIANLSFFHYSDIKNNCKDTVWLDDIIDVWFIMSHFSQFEFCDQVDAWKVFLVVDSEYKFRCIWFFVADVSWFFDNNIYICKVKIRNLLSILVYEFMLVGLGFSDFSGISLSFLPKNSDFGTGSWTGSWTGFLGSGTGFSSYLGGY